MIGATGMLGEAAAWVADRSGETVLVSRNAAAHALADRPDITGVSADWRDSGAFLGAVHDAGGLNCTNLALLWLHSDGAEAEALIGDALRENDCLVVKVRGSAMPRGPLEERPGNPAFRVITVRLGAVTTSHGRRWLTWPEISEGVISAIKARERRTVGTLP